METPTVVQAPVDHVANAVQNTQQQLATQLQKIQSMMQAMHTKITEVPHGTRRNYGGRLDYGGCGYHGNQSSYRGRGGDAAHKTTEIGAEAVVVDPTVFLQITVGHK